MQSALRPYLLVFAGFAVSAFGMGAIANASTGGEDATDRVGKTTTPPAISPGHLLLESLTRLTNSGGGLAGGGRKAARAILTLLTGRGEMGNNVFAGYQQIARDIGLLQFSGVRFGTGEASLNVDVSVGAPGSKILRLDAGRPVGEGGPRPIVVGLDWKDGALQPHRVEVLEQTPTKIAGRGTDSFDVVAHYTTPEGKTRSWCVAEAARLPADFDDQRQLKEALNAAGLLFQDGPGRNAWMTFQPGAYSEKEAADKVAEVAAAFVPNALFSAQYRRAWLLEAVTGITTIPRVGESTPVVLGDTSTASVTRLEGDTLAIETAKGMEGDLWIREVVRLKSRKLIHTDVAMPGPKTQAFFRVHQNKARDGWNKIELWSGAGSEPPRRVREYRTVPAPNMREHRNIQTRGWPAKNRRVQGVGAKEWMVTSHVIRNK